MATTVLIPADRNTSIPIIPINREWSVRVVWSVAGDVVPLIAATARWQVRLSLKSLEQGSEVPIGSHNEPVGASTTIHTYDRVVSVSGDLRGLTPGAYKLITILTLDNGDLPAPIAAYVEGPVVRLRLKPLG